MQETLQSLFVWALTLSGYPDPGALPELRTVSCAELSGTICNNAHFTAVAYYDSDSDTIYINERLDLATDRGARGYVMHEMVHYLQQQAGYLEADVIPCDIRIDLESEAYRVQHYFLKEHNESTYQVDLALALLKSFCSPP